ncbi:hypothetical protein [Streptomyces sp. NPDC086023]|uniref:hypothetical protein n=1 Tax=Streptomyces sp. NPDC086023 TaxID=3365746 RepID=UPI0037CF3CE2
MDEWPALAPNLAGHVALAGCDAATGELAVRPVSAPYATAVRHTGDSTSEVLRVACL